MHYSIGFKAGSQKFILACIVTVYSDTARPSRSRFHPLLFYSSQHDNVCMPTEKDDLCGFRYPIQDHLFSFRMIQLQAASALPLMILLSHHYLTGSLISTESVLSMISTLSVESNPYIRGRNTCVKLPAKETVI